MPKGVAHLTLDVMRTLEHPAYLVN